MLAMLVPMGSIEPFHQSLPGADLMPKRGRRTPGRVETDRRTRREPATVETAGLATAGHCPILVAMETANSDEALMLAYAAGSTAAFDALYQRHRAPLFRFLQRGISPRATAEECFQEVWSRVISARLRYQPDAAFTTWLYRIAQRILIDQYRRQGVRPQAAGEPDAVLESISGDESEQPDHALSEFELRRRLQRAMEDLPDEQRIALQLRLEQELSLEAIGEITGVGRETVKSRLRYAMDRLKGRLGS